jgi:hypothetical protein
LSISTARNVFGQQFNCRTDNSIYFPARGLY